MMVDLRSHDHNIGSIKLKPDDLGDIAIRLISYDFTTPRIRGFTTVGIGDTIDYLVDPTTDIQREYCTNISSFRDYDFNSC